MTMTSREQWANLDLPHKTGERNTGRKFVAKIIVDVEKIPCPAGQGENHQIVNNGNRLECLWCCVLWADLDLAANVQRSDPR